MMKKVYRKKFDAKAKAAKAKIKAAASGNQFKNLAEWVAFYQEHERLPSTKILCSACKKKETSMFGDNLKRNLPKFGSIEKLLTEFVCSDCRKAKGSAKPKEKPNKKERVNSDPDRNNAKDNNTEYLTREEMEDRKERIRATIPKLEYKPIALDLKDPAVVEDLTRGACQRPDIYLDAGCPLCPFYKHCACALKNDKVIESGERRKPGKRSK